MENIIHHISQRRSVRTYDGRELDASIRAQLMTFARSISNPFDVPVEFKLLDAAEHGLVCPVAVGTELFVGAKIKDIPMANLAFGYSFETFVLYAQSLGLGTVWLGGTMNRPAFEKAMELTPDEMMPCATAIGYTAAKMSMREIMMRKGVKADERLPFEELFFDGSFASPLSKENAGHFAEALEMVRLAPSAVNKQPWRVIIADGRAHFYLKRSKGFTHDGKLDMQMVDMGIALCHFELSAREIGHTPVFAVCEPDTIAAEGLEYIASYTLE